MTLVLQRNTSVAPHTKIHAQSLTNTNTHTQENVTREVGNVQKTTGSDNWKLYRPTRFYIGLITLMYQVK